MAIEMVKSGGFPQQLDSAPSSQKWGGEERSALVSPDEVGKSSERSAAAPHAGGTAPMQLNPESPVRDAQSPEPAAEKPYQPTPEELCEKYVDEETEREIILSRIYSGPDLEKALGRKPRLGLTSDLPFDCPIDPATGCLKKRPQQPEAPPTLPSS
jgi:hypothetical protein